jgi:hypothetical protein
LSPELWVPGAAEPSLDDFVGRIHKRVERFATERAGGQAAVTVELRDGSVHRLLTISPEPGYGFVTLCPWVEDGDAEELIVPVGAIARITLKPLEEHPPFGFTQPKAKAQGKEN